MCFDFSNRKEIECLPVSGCAFSGLHYDYAGREIRVSCERSIPAEKLLLDFRNVLFASFRRTGDAPQTEIFSGISVQEDCAPLRQLREFRERKEPGGGLLDRERPYCPVTLEMESGNALLIVCDSVSSRVQSAESLSRPGRVLEMLDRHNEPETQKQGLKLAAQLEDISMLLRPAGRLTLWENCAEALRQRTDEELSGYVPELFQWLKGDGPGGGAIYDRLSVMPTAQLAAAFSQSLAEARAAKDTRWTASLQFFAMEKPALLKSLPEEQRDFLTCWRGNWEV